MSENTPTDLGASDDLAALADQVLVSPSIVELVNEQLSQGAHDAFADLAEQVSRQVLLAAAKRAGLTPALEAAAENVALAVLAGQPRRPLAYPNCAVWLVEYLLPNYVRKAGSHVWCSSWFEHPEAITRVEGLWRSWETMRWDGGTGMSVWWRDYADVHMQILLSPDGPFFNCRIDHDLPEPFALNAPPPGTFD